jgi:hypothetical protein
VEDNEGISYAQAAYGITSDILDLLHEYLSELDCADAMIIGSAVGDVVVSSLLYEFLSCPKISKEATEDILDQRLELIKQTVLALLEQDETPASCEDDKRQRFFTLINPSNN